MTPAPPHPPPGSAAARNARREERRARQHEASTERAAAMNRERRATLMTSESPPPPGSRWYIGCSGWFYWHWKGVFYPAELPPSRWFSHYQKEFSTVELNAPFYSWPSLPTVKTWIRQAKTEGFVYTVKVCELITHSRRFRDTKSLIRDFGFIADMLGARMGCFLFQFPPSFHFTLPRLRSITDQLDPCRRNVVEFRHPSWWSPRVYDALRANRITFCSVNAPELPDALVNTSGQIYLRMHGSASWYRHNYTEAELAAVAASLRRVPAETSWIYFNNDHQGYAVQNAKLLSRLLDG